MITKIITRTYWDKEKERDGNIVAVSEVVNAKIIDSGKNEKGYYVEVELDYEN